MVMSLRMLRPSCSEQKRCPHSGFQLIQSAVLVGELEGLASVILAHIKAQSDDFRHSQLDPAAIINPELGLLVAVIYRRTGGKEARKLHATRRERADARSFRSGIQQKIVKALLNRHGNLLAATEIHAAAVISIAEFVARKAIGIERKPGCQAKAVVDAD